MATYVFKPSERPTLPGSPANPEHPDGRRRAYFAIGSLVGITAGLGNALVAVNLNYAQGTLGLNSDESVWLTATYAMTNVTANLLLVKYRQQFGLRNFVLWSLIVYAMAAALHLTVDDFATAVTVRAVSGAAGSGMSALTILYLMQAMTAPKRLFGVMIGISLPQLATPLARMLSPGLLGSGDWHNLYRLEFSLALISLAAVKSLALPPSERTKVFEPLDFLTFALLAPGLWLAVAVLSEGRIQWWTDRAWMGWALAAAVALIAAALAVENNRASPLINTHWLATREMLRLIFVASTVRVLLSEQAFGSIGLLTLLGMLNDQMITLNLIVLAASVAGLATAVLSFRAEDVTRSVTAAVILIAIGAFLDAGATNLTRPENLYLSQALIGFASMLFLGQSMVIGIARTILAGGGNFISFVVLFGISQTVGGLLGTALLGTFQVVREKMHSSELVGHIVLTDPLVSARLAAAGGSLSGVVGDTTLRNAQGTALLAQQIGREANVLAYNDVFLLVGVLALATALWGLVIRRSLSRRGEVSPILQLMQKMAAGQPSGGR